jgi:hypothetical protein
MRKLFFLAALLASGLSFAQSHGPQGPHKGRKQAKMENLSPEERADKMTAKMKKELSLSEDQEIKAKQANLEFAQQQEALRLKSEAIREERKSLMEAHKTKIKGILTPEQQKKADQLMKDRQEKRKEKRQNRRRN